MSNVGWDAIKEFCSKLAILRSMVVVWCYFGNERAFIFAARKRERGNFGKLLNLEFFFVGVLEVSRNKTALDGHSRLLRDTLATSEPLRLGAVCAATSNNLQRRGSPLAGLGK